MFRRRSRRVHPDLVIQDAYIKRRYNDLSVCIHKDIKDGRGRHNYYAPWLELKLQTFPAFYREKHSVLECSVPKDVEASPSSAPRNVAQPTYLVSPIEVLNRAPKKAWAQEDAEDKIVVPESESSTHSHKYKAQSSKTNTIPLPNHGVKHRDGFPRVGVNDIDDEGVQSEGQCSTAARVQKHTRLSFQETQTNEEALPNIAIDSEVAIEMRPGPEVSRNTSMQQPGAQQSRSSTHSSLCTIL